MVIISKPLFYSRIGPNVKCQDIYHNWTESCFKSIIQMSIYNFGAGIFFLYLPLHMIKLIIQYKKLSKKHFWNTFKAYLRSESFGLTYGFVALYSVCLSNKFLGRLHYYTIAFLPGFLSGVSIFCETPTNRLLNSLLWGSLVIEALINNTYYFKIIKYSPLLETVIFMYCSSILMYLLINKDEKEIPFNLWFYNPAYKRHHSNRSLIKDHLLDIFKYFGIGYGMSSAKSLFGKAMSLYKTPSRLIFEVFCNKKHIRLGTMFGLYVGVFKIMLTVLNKYRGNKKTNAAIAGFIAGTSYYVKPTIQILTISMVTILQLIVKKPFKDSRLNFLPITEILYMISNSILFYNRIIAAPTCPKYFTNMLRIASGGLIDELYHVIVNEYFSEPHHVNL